MFATVLLPGFAQAQKPMDLHGLRPGMLTREIILQSHSKIDTMMWGGLEGASMLSFKGALDIDSGEFRISVVGPTIRQVLFISRATDTTHARLAFERIHMRLEKLFGRAEKYVNDYHIYTWELPGQQMKLSTRDHALFYSIVLAEHETPGDTKTRTSGKR